MNLFTSMKVFHHEFAKVHLKRRAVPLAALVLTTSMTVPVLAAGVDIYEITDGTTTERVSLYQEDAESALAAAETMRLSRSMTMAMMYLA